MKKLLLAIMTIGVLNNVYSQALFVEEFNYNTGQLTASSSGANTSGGNWVGFSGTTALIQVTSGSLSYSNYPSSAIGNKISLTAQPFSTGEDVQRTFATTNSGTLYVSFLLQITDTSTLLANSNTTGDYFMSFQPTSYFARLSIRKGAQPGTVQLGLRANSSTTVAWSSDFQWSGTNLVVFSYSFVSGTANDTASLWINPSLTGPQPAPDLTSTAAADASSLSLLAIRQAANTPGCNIDGLRLATSWADAPLPVQFKSFTATKGNDVVNLKWSTASESNNKGFEVQRSVNGAKYQTVGFVKGNGNSNVVKTYSFTDAHGTTGNICYRLKQIDFNGASEFSKVVCVNVELEKTTGVFTTPNPFNGSLHLKYNSATEGTANVQIIDMLGKSHQNINMFVNKGENTLTLDTEALPLGIYFIRVTNGAEVTTQRIVKK